MKKPNKVKFSVVIPTRNEEKSIGNVIKEIPKKIKKQAEIIIVDTNSTDKTVSIAKKLGAIIINEPRRGYGKAYKTGFKHARGEIIITSDGDLTYPIGKIGKFIEMLENEKLGFITCDRLSMLDSNNMRAMHRFGNRILSLSANLLFGMHIKDSQSGMWIFRKSILPKLKLKSDGMPFSEEIKIEAWRRGIPFKEIKIKYRKRKGYVKLNTWRDGTRNLIFILKKRFV